MSISTNAGEAHIELNGVLYDIAEDAEGDHYIQAGEPSRPPNAVTVQGEASQKFQMRPDVLLWSLTDWSGGEGQYKFNPQAPNRWWQLTGVRVFEKPGTLKPGYYVAETVDSGGSADFAIEGALVLANNKLILLDVEANDGYVWNASTSRWGALVDLAPSAAGANFQAYGDASHVYWIETATNNVYKWDTAATITKISDALIIASSTSYLNGVGSNVYVSDASGFQVFEIAKSGSSETEIDNYTGDAGSPAAALPAWGHAQQSALNGKMYVMVTQGSRTMVREINPTTAAGTGFGAEIARIQGFQGEAMWSHSGMLFILGSESATAHPSKTILYLQPGGDFGSLGRLREGDDLGVSSGVHDQGGRMLDHFLVVPRLSGSTNRHALFQIDSVSGGIACLAVDEDGNAAGENVLGLAAFNNDIFWSTRPGGATERVMRARYDQYTKNSSVISPWHDFDLADTKILTSLTLSTEALPADWTVFVDYATNGGTSFTNVISYTTDGGTGTKAVVSTDSSQVSFKTLQIRIRMSYTGAGVPSTAPTIHGVDVQSKAVLPRKVWRIIVRLDAGRSGALPGPLQVSNVKTVGQLGSVVDFKDGYISSVPGVYDQVDVVVDAYRILLHKPGEGIAELELHEVT